MKYSGPIKRDQLIDAQPLIDRGECPYTFLAFPASSVNEFGVPANDEAQEYIAAVQRQGVSVGIWIDTPVEDTSYAFVGKEHIKLLHQTLDALKSTKRFSGDFAANLSERLLGEHER